MADQLLPDAGRSIALWSSRTRPRGSDRDVVCARAWLFECLDRLDEAEADYVDLANRYDQRTTRSASSTGWPVSEGGAFEPRLQAGCPSCSRRGCSPRTADARRAPPRRSR